MDIGGPSAVLPRGLTSFGAARSDGSLYVLGGYFGTPHEYSEAGQSGELLRLELESGSWSRLGEVDRAQSVALVAHQGQLLRIGGMQARNPAGTPADLHSLDVVEAFDVKTSTWNSLPSLPEPRSSHDAIVADGMVWVVGGWALQGQQRKWHDTILRLDPANPSEGWAEFEAPFERRALAVAAAGGKLVALGGIDRQRRMSSAVDVYDPATDRWSEGPAFPGPGFGMAAVSHGDAIYASGMEGVVHRWRPGEASWTRLSTLAYPRFFHRMVATSSGDLLVLGGIRTMESGTRVRPIERIPTEQRNDPTLLAYALPSPLPSKNRQGVAIHGDTLYVFGGNKSLGQHDFEPEFFTDEGQALDLASMEWRPIAPYPEPRQTMSTFVTEWGQIVSVGGFGHDGEVARSHPEVFAYHPRKDQWSQIGRLPGQGRTQFGLAARKEEVMLFGGLDYDPRRPKDDRFRHETELLRAPMKPSGMDFQGADIDLREPRRAFAGAMLGDRYYVVGGMKEGFSLVDTCEAYDFTAGKKRWAPISCPNHPRLSAQMVAMGGKLYLAAGSSKGPEGTLASDPSLEVYDPATDAWTVRVERLPIEPKHLRMLPYGDRLVLLSTHDEDGVVHVVLLDP